MGSDGLGLFDGFDGYRTPTSSDYAHVLTSGLVVPDTNVLLNLYRYNPETRSDLISVLERLDTGLWVPHQVMVEFWKNREAALRDPMDMASKTAAAFDRQLSDTRGSFTRWAGRLALSHEKRDELLADVEDGFKRLRAKVLDFAHPKPDLPEHDTNEDPVLQQLEPLLEGRIGHPPDTDEAEQARSEGKRRLAEGIPPGFADREKGEEAALGDFLVWDQTVREAARRKIDVLLVTGDVKEDWWRRERDEVRGPRPELADELRSRANSRLFMLRPESLLEHARSALQVMVRTESLQEVERVERTTSTSASPSGWTVDTLAALLDQLAIEAPVQEAAIIRAAEADGFVSREEVYQLGHYDSSRTLRGFTRPVRRISQEFRESGELPSSAKEVLEAVYESSVSYVQAAGFRVPDDVVPLVGEVIEGS